MLPIHFVRRVIGQILLELFDRARARGTNGGVEDGIVGQAAGNEASRPIPECLQLHDIDCVRIGCVPMVEQIERQAVSALEHRVLALRLEGKAEIHGAGRGDSPRGGVRENQTEHQRRGVVPGEAAHARARAPAIDRAMPQPKRRHHQNRDQGDEYHGTQVQARNPGAGKKGGAGHRRRRRTGGE